MRQVAPLRIAQVSPLFESVPPRLYGGTERIVSYLTEELVRRGHEVTLFASADSATRAELCAQCPRAIRLAGDYRDLGAPHFVMFEQLRREASRFDIIHFHNETMHLNIARSIAMESGTRHITTLHGRLDLPEYIPLFKEFSEIPVVSISTSQRKPLSFARWLSTVHHGLPSDAVPFYPEGGEYLAFLGRISREKRVERAIEIARLTGHRIKIAAKFDEYDFDYVDSIKPLLKEDFVDFIGEIGDREKPAFLGRAKALLFPIDWPEPFGLVMIEAMAAGTPVIAFNAGSVAEIIAHGFTGYIVKNIEEACSAVRRIDKINRTSCRRHFESHFTVEKMVDRYEAVYRSVLATPEKTRVPVSARGTQLSTLGGPV